MTTLAEPFHYLAAARDDARADIVPAHLAARRMEQRLMLITALLAAAVLTGAIVHGWVATRALPDLATFAFRV